MTTNRKLRRSAALAALLVLPLLASAVSDLTAGLEYLGIPSAERWNNPTDARSVLDLQVHGDKVIVGGGEWSNNSGPVFLMGIDPYTGLSEVDYKAGTEATETIRTFQDGRLYVPATDHLDAGDYPNGYWFRRAQDGTWDHGFGNGVANTLFIHTWDMESCGDWIFACGYGIAGSKDDGKTWKRLDDQKFSARFYTFIRCGEEVFCTYNSTVYFKTKGASAVPNPANTVRMWRWNAANETFDAVTNTWANYAPGITLGDCMMVNTNLTNVGRPARAWHATPFGNRCLYIIGDEYSGRNYTVNGKESQYVTIGTRPEIAVSGYAENGLLKGDRIVLPSKTYPIDFTVVGDTAYMLTFRYKSATQMVEHGIWKSTDGVNFTQLFTVDYQQVMMSLEYHMGYFYLGVAHKNAQIPLGTLKAGTPEMAGAVYRVYCPQEPCAVVASSSAVTVAEGGSSDVTFALSAAPTRPVSVKVACSSERVTLSATDLTFTPANWNVPQTVRVTYPENASADPAAVQLVCGEETPASFRGRFASTDVTPALVAVALQGNDRLPTVSEESFRNAAVPFAYTATFADFGTVGGVSATSCALTLTAYADAAHTERLASVSTMVATTDPVTLTLPDLARGEWMYFVVEARTAEGVVRRVTHHALTPIGRSEQLVDLTDDLARRAGCYGVNANASTGNSGAWDNGTSYFGGYAKPSEAIYEFTEPTVVNGFGLCGMLKASDNTDRAPYTYSLSGCNDTNGTWTVLKRCEKDPQWRLDGEWRRVLCANTDSYRYYKISLEKSQMPNMPWVMASEAELYYVHEPDENVLTVAGDPYDVGSPTPGYGTSMRHRGDVISVSVPAVAYLDADESALAVCRGWRAQTAAGAAVASRGACTGSFVFPGEPVTLTYDFEMSNRVSVAVASGAGRVEGVGWYAPDATATVTAIPAAGYVFAGWMGAVSSTEPTVSLTMEQSRRLLACFEPVGTSQTTLYVTTTGSDAGAGNVLAPLLTVSNAVARLGAAGGRIVIGSGVFEQKSPLVVTAAVEIVGSGTGFGATVLRNTGTAAECRVLELNHPAASCTGAIVEGGTLRVGKENNSGAGICLKAGVVSNCVIRGCSAVQSSSSMPYGGGVHVCGPEALLTHCEVRDCTTRFDANWGSLCAAGVQVTAGGRVVATRIVGCHSSAEAPGYQKMVGGLVVTDGSAYGCTVEDCWGSHTGGIYAKADKNKTVLVENCTVRRCTRRLKDADGVVQTTYSPWNGTEACFVNCTFEEDAPAAVELTAAETQAEAVSVPCDWLTAQGFDCSTAEQAKAAALAMGANGLTVWQSYVADLVPSDPTSRFTAKIVVSAEGKPEVTWTPASAARTYKVVGKASLADEKWTEKADNHKFFKVIVSLP